MWKSILKDLLINTELCALAEQLHCPASTLQHIESGFVKQPYLMLGIRLLNYHAKQKPELYQDDCERNIR